MKTAIIGLGNIGAQVAKNLTAGGENIILADRSLAKSEQLATELTDRATPMAIADAISKSDVIILAIYFNVIKELIATYNSAPAGKIVVDPSNPIAPDGKGGFKKIIPPDQSSGRLIAALLPEGTELVKHLERWAPNLWATALIVRRNPPSCFTRRIIPRREELLRS